MKTSSSCCVLLCARFQMSHILLVIRLFVSKDNDIHASVFIHNSNLQKGLEHTSKGLNIIDKISYIIMLYIPNQLQIALKMP